MSRALAALLCSLPLSAAAALLPPLQGDGRLHGSFTQSKTVAGLSKPVLSLGSFSLAGEQGLVWRTEKPLQASVVLAKSGLWALDAKGSRKLAGGGEALATMRQVLARDEAGLQRAFKVQAKGTAKAWTLNLEPLSPALAKVIKSLEVRGGSQVRSLRLLEANGDRTQIELKGVSLGSGALAPAEAVLLER